MDGERRLDAVDGSSGGRTGIREPDPEMAALNGGSGPSRTSCVL
jgi:hypothetical protein